MTVTVIALVTVNENQPMALAQYLEATSPLLDKAGGKIVRRFKVEEPVVGQKPSQTMIVVEYPDRAAVDYVFKSDIYKSIIELRDMAFETYQVSIVTNDPLDITNGSRDSEGAVE